MDGRYIRTYLFFFFSFLSSAARGLHEGEVTVTVTVLDWMDFSRAE